MTRMVLTDIGWEVVDCQPTSEQLSWGKRYKERRRKMRAVMVKAYRRAHRFATMPITRTSLYYGDDDGRAE